MTEFINAMKNYVNFTDRTTVRGYWMAFLIYIVVTVVLFALTFVGTFSNVLYIIWALGTVLPMLAMQIRRLRDMGKRWTYIFIQLIPCVGSILYIIALTKPSIPDDGVPQV